LSFSDQKSTERQGQKKRKSRNFIYHQNQLNLKYAKTKWLPALPGDPAKLSKSPLKVSSLPRREAKRRPPGQASDLLWALAPFAHLHQSKIALSAPTALLTLVNVLLIALSPPLQSGSYFRRRLLQGEKATSRQQGQEPRGEMSFQ
jgi:hypothetical protein